MRAKLGIVRNPKSRANLKTFPQIQGDALLREPGTPGELSDVMREFAAREIGLLAIDGGDGTIRDVLSLAVQAFERMPPVTLVASGKTNILASNVGSWGVGTKGLDRLVAFSIQDLPSLHRHSHPTLQIGFAGRQLHGFVLGTGAYARAVALADRGGADRFSRGSRVALTIARSVASAARRRERRLWLDGSPMTASFDGIASPDTARLLFLATTLRRFMLGVWPFWGGGAQPVRYLDIKASPSSFAAALFPVLAGRPRPWMRDAGYRSGTAGEIRLEVSEPFVLDGEAFSPGPDGRVVVEAGPCVDFLSPS